MLPQQEFWVSREQIVQTSKDTYYDRLSADMEAAGFGDAVRDLCAPYYSASGGGRPPIDPEVYFKMLVVGFFEGIGSERGIASRCEDSISIRRFLRYDLTESTPDHSSLSRIRQRLPLEVFEEAFALSLRPLSEAGLLDGESIALDSSLLEANASKEKLCRREDGVRYLDYVRALAEAEGIDPKDTDAVVRFDRTRKGKSVSNEEWFSPNDPEAKLGPRKDGAWDMIHKVENAVDLDSGALLSVQIQPADKADSEGMADHMEAAAGMVDYTRSQLAESDGPEDEDEDEDEDDGDGEGSEDEGGQVRTVRAVCDKGYHKMEELQRLSEAGIEPVVSEPAGRAVPSNKGDAKVFERNRENISGDNGKELMGRRSELGERSFRHILDHGGMRRTTLVGHDNVSKRMLIAGLAFNFSIHAWHVHGVGTPKQALAWLLKQCAQAIDPGKGLIGHLLLSWRKITIDLLIPPSPHPAMAPRLEVQ